MKFFEIVEREGGAESELQSGAGNEVFGSEDEEGGTGLFGEVAEAVPGRGRDLAKFFERVELEIENEEGEIAIVEEKVGTAEGFFGVMATDPEEAGAGRGAVGGGIERVATVDESERFGCQFSVLSWQLGSWRFAFRVLKNLGQDEGEAGGGAGRREFGESAGGEGGETGGGANRGGRRVGLMCFRESFPQLSTQTLEIRGH